jgi:hypothetical protein
MNRRPRTSPRTCRPRQYEGAAPWAGACRGTGAPLSCKPGTRCQCGGRRAWARMRGRRGLLPDLGSWGRWRCQHLPPSAVPAGDGTGNRRADLHDLRTHPLTPRITHRHRVHLLQQHSDPLVLGVVERLVLVGGVITIGLGLRWPPSRPRPGHRFPRTAMPDPSTVENGRSSARSLALPPRDRAGGNPGRPYPASPGVAGSPG